MPVVVAVYDTPQMTRERFQPNRWDSRTDGLQDAAREALLGIYRARMVRKIAYKQRRWYIKYDILATE